MSMDLYSFQNKMPITQGDKLNFKFSHVSTLPAAGTVV